MGEDESRRAEAVLLTAREVAAMLRVSANCVYDLIAKGKLACYRVGVGRGAIRLRRSDVEAYLDACRKEKREEAPRMPRARLKHLTI
jgi:excisionase family DNA binding protein